MSDYLVYVCLTTTILSYSLLIIGGVREYLSGGGEYPRKRFNC